MAGSIGVRHTFECHEPILRRGATELPAKCTREHFMAGEARIDRYFQHRLFAGHESGGRAGESQTLRMLLWSFAGKPTEGAVQMKWRPPCASGQSLQRKVLVEAVTDLLQQVKEVTALH